MLHISVSDRAARTTTYDFDGPCVRIGRGGDNDVILPDRACSRHHAEVRRENGVYRLKDLQSANGTFHGNDRIDELVLIDGAAVSIGEITLTFTIPQPVATRVLVYDAGQGLKNLQIAPGVEYVIGRSPRCDIVIDDSRCSKRHCMIYSRGDEVHVRDLGSSNGTYVNGKRVTEAPLNVGDKITVGEVLLTLEDEKVSEDDRSVIMDRTQLFAQLPAGLEGPAPTPRPSRRGLWIGGAATLALAVAVGGWLLTRSRPAENAGAGREKQTGFVKVARVEPKSMVFAVSGTGSVKPKRTVTVSAEVSGRVLEITVDENATVRQGDVIAMLNDRDIKLQINEARSSVTKDQVDLARGDYERKSRLFQQDVITRSAYEGSKNSYLSLSAAYQSAQARVQQLNEMLGKTKIVAPISGLVIRKFVSAGEFVGPGGPVVMLGDMNHAVVELEIPDRDVVKIHDDQQVEARTDAYPDRVFRGVIDEVGTTANPTSRTFRVEAALDNADLSLRNGMIVSLRIIVEQANALIAPQEALIGERDGTATVFVADQGKARAIKVRTGRRLDREVEILEGLTPGQEVVTYGQQSLSDGQSVKTY